MDRQRQIVVSNMERGQSIPVSQSQNIQVITTGGVTTPATREKLGLVKVGSDLLITNDGVLSVDKATLVEQDNTKPITSAAVYAEVGNINALLATI